MQNHLRDALDNLAKVILILGAIAVLGLLAVFLLSLFGISGLPHAAVTLAVGLQIFAGAMLVGGSVRLLVSIDRRLERLEGKS